MSTGPEPGLQVYGMYAIPDFWTHRSHATTWKNGYTSALLNLSPSRIVRERDHHRANPPYYATSLYSIEGCRVCFGPVRSEYRNRFPTVPRTIFAICVEVSNGRLLWRPENSVT